MMAESEIERKFRIEREQSEGKAVAESEAWWGIIGRIAALLDFLRGKV